MERHELESLLDQVHKEYLLRMTQGDGQLLQQVEHYLASRNGKMLRPRMTLTAAATLGEAQLHSRKTLLLAVCVEMLHNTSLLHDDVIDRADTRRGRPSVNAHWNNAIAVLVGDYHLAKIMELLEEVDDAEVSHMVNNVVKSMVESELLQQEILSGRQMTEKDYLDIIDGKTALLFAVAAALGNPACRDFGFHYGRLFQLRDDLADGESTPWTEQLIVREEQAINQLQLILNI